MKYAFVTPRYGAELVDGPEHACRLLAERVSRRHDVDVLTTCARDQRTWKNEHQEGTDSVRGVIVRRFAVNHGQDRHSPGPIVNTVPRGAHTRSDELAWVERHGPSAPGLLDFLKRQHRQYDALVFFSLQHATTVQGLAVAPERSVIFPHLQCEPALRFGLWSDLVASARGVGLLSSAERRVLQAFMPNSAVFEEVVGIGTEPAPPVTYPRHQQDPNDEVHDEDAPVDPDANVEDYLAGRGIPFRRRHRLYGPMALYAGRLEPNNGTEELLEYFFQYAPSDPEASLVLLGPKMVKVPTHPQVRLAGVVPARDRVSAFEAAEVTIAPSSTDLLAESVLESFAVGTPVLASARNTTAVDHCRRAGAGLYYENATEFAEALRTLMTNARLRERLGLCGQHYAQQHLKWDGVLGRFERLVSRVKR